jgi:hypothetical protein
MVTLKPGWLFDYATGTLAVDPSKRSAFAAATVRGGVVNAPARDILPRFGIPILPTYAASIPLHENHDMMQGTTSVDCIHYCAPGMGEITIYELWRKLRAGSAAVQPLPEARSANARRPLPYSAIV